MHPLQDKMSALREKWRRRLEHDGRREFIEICRKIVSIENLTTLEYDKFDSVMQQRYVDRPDFSGYDARPQSPPATTGAMPPPNIVKPKGATASSWDDDSGRFLVIRHRFQEYCVKFFLPVQRSLRSSQRWTFPPVQTTRRTPVYRGNPTHLTRT